MNVLEKKLLMSDYSFCQMKQSPKIFIYIPGTVSASHTSIISLRLIFHYLRLFSWATAKNAAF